MSLVMNPISLREVEVIRETLGMNLMAHPNRNQFYPPKGSDDFLYCLTLVERGLMRHHRTSPTGRGEWFSTTEHVYRLFAPPEDCFS